ncbi:Nicotinamide/nicotinic acid mononucleotide adenylyltransferase 2 [Metarhizium acridum]|uniref:Nicotinamide/nicotinic acid mononucleotide adenylyltransferase 2 n=1 Tax=Metarhizium acridum TaxID=92637 RepID=UPI001C6AD078|nr:Nicotinamide/nicotinic acid mononucleotide adenylyltransferase 2 [Metarhizium acridum]
MASDFPYVKKMTPEGHVFPSQRLRRICDPDRTPLVLVACGSCVSHTGSVRNLWKSSPDYVTYQDGCATSTGFHVIGGYLSPVSDAYKKKGLVPAHHRIQLCD